jgi:hypothetical protein
VVRADPIENQLGFDSATSLGGLATLFQFKASHTVSARRGRRFKVEHEQMEILQNSFGQHPGTCYYVFPDVGNIADLNRLQSNVIGNSYLVDVANLPAPIPQPFKNGTTQLRKDNCHYAYFDPTHRHSITFHSQPFPVRAMNAKQATREFGLRMFGYPTESLVELLKAMAREHRRASRLFFRNTVMGIVTP